MKKVTTLKKKISRYFLLSTVILLIVSVTAVGYITYKTYSEYYNDTINRIAEEASTNINGDAIEQYVKEGKVSPELLHIQDYVNNVYRSFDDREVFIFVIWLNEDANGDVYYIGIADGYDEHELEDLEANDLTLLGSRYALEGDEKKNFEDAGVLALALEGRGSDEADRIFKTNIVDTSLHSLYAWAPIPNSKGETFGALVNVQISYEGMLMVAALASGVVATLIILSMLLLMFSVDRILSRNVYKPLGIMTNHVKSFHEGKYENERLCLETGDEIQVLSESFNDLNDRINQYIEKVAENAREEEKRQTELDVAANIQLSMLPGNPLAAGNTEVYAMMNPAKEVGGDFYDYFMVDDTHLAIVVADVSDKGIPAALFMARGKTLLKAYTMQGLPLNEVFTKVNEALFEGNAMCMFITAFEGILDLTNGRFVYANAGHEKPVLRHTNGQFELLQVGTDIPLAAYPDFTFTQREFNLAPGERLFQYTDGVTEARNKDRAFFGEEGLLDFLTNHTDEPFGDVLPKMMDALIGYQEGTIQYDDITLLYLQYGG